MKELLFITILSTITFGGFFNETAAKDKAEFIENDRLCKIFTKKVDGYKKTMRDDFLAQTTLSSYEYRASLFCNKANDLRGNIADDNRSNMDNLDTNTTDLNSTTSKELK